MVRGEEGEEGEGLEVEGAERARMLITTATKIIKTKIPTPPPDTTPPTPKEVKDKAKYL